MMLEWTIKDVLTAVGSVGFPIVMALLMYSWVQRFLKVLEDRDDKFSKLLAERDGRFEKVLGGLNRSINLQNILIARWTGQNLIEVARETLACEPE